MKKYILLTLLLLPLAVADLEVRCNPFTPGTLVDMGVDLKCDVITTAPLININEITFDVAEGPNTITFFQGPKFDAIAQIFDYSSPNSKAFSCESDLAIGTLSCVITEPVIFDSGARLATFLMTAGSSDTSVSLQPIILGGFPNPIIASDDLNMYPTGDATPSTIVPALIDVAGDSSSSPTTPTVTFPWSNNDALTTEGCAADGSGGSVPTIGSGGIVINGDAANVLIVMEDLDFFPNQDASPGIHWLYYGGPVDFGGAPPTSYISACPPQTQTDCTDYPNAFGSCLTHNYKFTAYDASSATIENLGDVGTRAELDAAITGTLTPLSTVTTTYTRPSDTLPTPQPLECTGNLPTWATTACGTENPAGNAQTYSFVQTCNGETSKCIYECPANWELVNERGTHACRNVGGTVEAVGGIMRGDVVGGTNFGELTLLEKISAIAAKLKAFFS